VLNDKNNLSMLDPAANKAKAKLAANPKGDPKRKAIAMHYLQQSSIKQKASKTMAELGRAAKKHKIKNVGYASSIKSFVRLTSCSLKPRSRITSREFSPTSNGAG
jgi:hypothetical protein